jgi:hypothetical protein
MPADNELDALDRWLNQQVHPLPPPPGTFELITKRAHRRKIRKAVISVASAVAAAAAVAVAVPVGMSMHLTTTPTNANLAAGGNAATPSGGTTQPAPGTATTQARPFASNAAAAGASAAGPTTPGYLPPNFQPYSVTWDSLSTGWIMGPAGTPGHCGAQQNSTVCTSIAQTSDGGQTWHGLPAPPVGGPMAATGVTGLRFLNASYGWAFGPELWATDDGAENWHKVNTGGASVTDLETMNGRAYALFGDCTAPAGMNGDTIAGCRSYTLETATAGSDNWTPVGGVPAALPAGTTALGSAALELAGATDREPATGYLVAPDGTLYAGPLDGSAWHKVLRLPCSPGPANTDGLPQALLLTPAGTTSAGVTRLAMVCTQIATGTSSVYLSTDNGSTWTEQRSIASTPATSVPQSLTALPDGTLILAAIPGGGGLSGGIYLLTPGATQWHAATLSPTGWATPVGFTYVGMTSATQGVALSSDSSQHAIWMTADGGKTWQARPIKS